MCITDHYKSSTPGSMSHPHIMSACSHLWVYVCVFVQFRPSQCSKPQPQVENLTRSPVIVLYFNVMMYYVLELLLQQSLLIIGLIWISCLWYWICISHKKQTNEKNDFEDVITCLNRFVFVCKRAQLSQNNWASRQNTNVMLSDVKEWVVFISEIFKRICKNKLLVWIWWSLYLFSHPIIRQWWFCWE